MTKVRVNTREMMDFVKGRRMDESDLCMLLENLGVVLDKSTWMHFKEVYAKAHEGNLNGNFYFLTSGFILVKFLL